MGVEQALIRAASKGQIDEVNRLLAIPAIQAAVTAIDNAAFRLAAENGHLAVVERLLAIPAVVEAATATAYGNEAFCWAARNGHSAVVERLLAIPAVRAAVAANDNYALRQAVARSSKYGRDPEKKQEYLSVLFRLLQAYKEENIIIPPDIKIEGHKVD